MTVQPDYCVLNFWRYIRIIEFLIKDFTKSTYKEYPQKCGYLPSLSYIYNKT
jgi:hypothetical protein